ncbi:lipopolysaccharide biosynthesis protein [Butyrivibrio sp. FCS006]|uniref:lipopolysaccharide biosynthesis protein n=1 Tax=Butyrivibrio sp. FCS006 TaxID=1280684 RepID=UPI0018CB6074|nr:oligosaccharide flippase family protein [Butyrivibrio sp. FCS006]
MNSKEGPNSYADRYISVSEVNKTKVATTVNYGNKNLKHNSMIMMATQFISMGLSLITAPLMLQGLGEEKYGIWTSLLGIVSWIYYFDLGLGGGLQNKLSTALAQNRNEDANKYVGTSYAFLSLISGIGFIICALFFYVINVPKFFHYDSIGEDVTLVLIVALFFACINFVTKLVENILYATQNAGLVGLFGLVAQLMWIGVLIIYVETGNSYLFWFVVAQGTINLIKNIMASFYVWARFPQFRGAFKSVQKSYAKDIMSFGILLFINNVGSLVLNTTDNLVISRYFGAVDVTPYSFCQKFFGIIQAVFAAAVSPYFAAYTAAYAQNNADWLIRTLKKLWRVWGLFAIFSILGIFIFRPFAAFWLRKELNYQVGLIPLFAGYYILLMFGYTVSSFVNATYQTKKIIMSTVIGTIINIPFSIWLAVNAGFGVDGVVLGSIASMVITIGGAAYVVFKSLKKIKLATVNGREIGQL